MGMQCAICGKRPSKGNNVSHANNKTRRNFKPNLQKVSAVREGKKLRLTVCTRCLRSGKVTKR